MTGMNEQTDNPQSKKIIIDEDWKAKAQAEKEELARKQQSGQAQETKPQHHAPLPPASLEMLAASLGMQAMICLGLVPDPVDNKTEIDLVHAKHFIDTIAVLYDKTEGNRTADETAALDDLLHQLRLNYVVVAERGTAKKA